MIQWVVFEQQLYEYVTETAQIAVKEAIPFLEFEQNPLTVLCTTSLGGHLSWFEMGGGRWFAKPVSWLLDTFERPILTSVKGKPVFDDDI